MSSLGLPFDTIFDRNPQIIVNGKVDLLALLNTIESLVSQPFTIRNCLEGVSLLKQIKLLSPFKVAECIYLISKGCSPQVESEIPKRRRRNSIGVNDADSTLMQLSIIVNSVRNLQDLFILLYGDESWIDLSCDDETWNDAVIQENSKLVI